MASLAESMQGVPMEDLERIIDDLHLNFISGLIANNNEYSELKKFGMAHGIKTNYDPIDNAVGEYEQIIKERIELATQEKPDAAEGFAVMGFVLFGQWRELFDITTDYVHAQRHTYAQIRRTQKGSIIAGVGMMLSSVPLIFISYNTPSMLNFASMLNLSGAVLAAAGTIFAKDLTKPDYREIREKLGGLRQEAVEAYATGLEI